MTKVTKSTVGLFLIAAFLISLFLSIVILRNTALRKDFFNAAVDGRIEEIILSRSGATIKVKGNEYLGSFESLNEPEKYFHQSVSVGDSIHKGMNSNKVMVYKKGGEQLDFLLYIPDRHKGPH